jgi:hypothetical protein
MQLDVFDVIRTHGSRMFVGNAWQSILESAGGGLEGRGDGNERLCRKK